MHVRSHRTRPWLVALALLASPLVSVVAVVLRPVDPAAAVAVGVPSIPDTDYPRPVGSLHVSPTGNDTAAGTLANPLRTVARALALVPDGGTIVLRAGTYREALGAITDPVTIQAYPHEQAWLDGRQIVTGWSTSGGAWVHAGWSSTLCQNCYDPLQVTPERPAAGLPDMVFLDGAPQQQVLSRAEVVPGTFFHDDAANALYLGTNPAGHQITATVHQKALSFNTAGATGSVLRGVGVIGYGTNGTGTNLAMVIVDAPKVTVENVVLAWAATRGIAVYDTDALLHDVVVVNNGLQGIAVDQGDGLIVDGARVAGSNREGFLVASSPNTTAAGMKLTSSRDVVVRDSTFDDNDSTGLWVDVSSQNITVVRNVARRNARHGLFVEISDQVVVASNLVTDNVNMGLRVAGTTNARIWNNTFADNLETQIGVYETARTNENTAEYAAGITWDTRNVQIRNNILSTSKSTRLALLHTGDWNSPKRWLASDLISALDGNVYARTATALPPNVVYWANLTPNSYATNYATVGAFRNATVYEDGGIEVSGTDPLFVDRTTGDYRLAVGSPAFATGGTLPSDVASFVGVAPGATVDRGTLSWATGTITPSERIRVSTGDAAVFEGDGATRTIWFPITLSAPARSVVTAYARVTAGTAVGGTVAGPSADFNNGGGVLRTVTFTPATNGNTPTTRFVGVNVFGDTRSELTETIQIELIRPDGLAILGRTKGTGRIVNDEGAALRVGVAGGGIAEGDVGARSMPVTVALSGTSSAAVTVRYRVVPVTASGGTLTNPSNDVDHMSGTLLTLEIPAGSLQRSIIVTVGSDLAREGTELWQVVVDSATGAQLLNTTASGQIVDDD